MDSYPQEAGKADTDKKQHKNMIIIAISMKYAYAAVIYVGGNGKKFTTA